MKAAVGWIHGGLVQARFVRCVLDLVHGDLKGRGCFDFRLIPVESSMYVNVGRNNLVEAFLRYPRNVDRLLMLDSDIVFTPEQAKGLVALVSAERPVVSGVYKAANGEEVFDLVMERNKDGRMVPMATGEGLQVIGGCGGGFMAIHRSVLEAMPRKLLGGRPTWFN